MKSIIDAQWKCEKCGKKEWTDIRQFNMMFQTQQGAVE
jgi:glycyl-tRNA synthetase (class II)